jgi:hypothetical protein
LISTFSSFAYSGQPHLILIANSWKIFYRWADQLHGHVRNARKRVLHNNSKNLRPINSVGRQIDGHRTAQRSAKQDYLAMVQIMTTMQIVDRLPCVRKQATLTWMPGGETIATIFHHQNVARQKVIDSAGVLQTMARIASVSMKVNNRRYKATLLAWMTNPEGVKLDLVGILDLNTLVRQTELGGHRYKNTRMWWQIGMVQNIVLGMIENT